ncbi:hypothetical protein CFOL_v3_31392 [Cephalotus follicularis]|uniref:Uncharacterized protein n=1 Tax=Cephalotus follicularis TaxID=3775 RepID=A0A1Q3D6U8_CEPFO|nr:hypothetical protein CFOL_v3_31392 [Cephalotus follicularis]
MEHGTSQSHSSMPLASRLDHLDFIMKYLERKQEMARWGSREDCMPMPLDLALRDAYFKGSFLDRVASLEHRLFQVTNITMYHMTHISITFLTTLYLRHFMFSCQA